MDKGCNVSLRVKKTLNPNPKLISHFVVVDNGLANFFYFLTECAHIILLTLILNNGCL